MSWSTLTLVTLVGMVACTEAPVAPADIGEAPIALSKGKPPAGPAPISATSTISDVDAGGGQTDVRSDGRGAYVDGECGVAAEIRWRDDGQWGTNLWPAATEATCGAPREATLRVAVRHVSDNPHVDDASAPLGVAAIGNYGIALGDGSAKINAAPLCFKVSRRGSVSGSGLRFDPAAYPGSSSLAVTQLGADSYRVQTRPWPDNLAYCEDNNGISFWHVVLDVQVGPNN